MKLKKLLEINQMCETGRIHFDIQESFEYESSSEGNINILDMDIVHFVRAFKLLNKQSNPKVEGSLHWISDRLTGLANELKEYTDE
tara:strand:+ start:58 stop:315 length:258 start_codon:yes stop_codon:yes gene_type:complete